MTDDTRPLNKCDLCVYNRQHAKGISDGRCMPVFRTKKTIAALQYDREASIRRKRPTWRIIETAWDIPHDCPCLMKTVQSPK